LIPFTIWPPLPPERRGHVRPPHPTASRPRRPRGRRPRSGPSSDASRRTGTAARWPTQFHVQDLCGTTASSRRRPRRYSTGGPQSVTAKPVGVREFVPRAAMSCQAKLPFPMWLNTPSMTTLMPWRGLPAETPGTPGPTRPPPRRRVEVSARQRIRCGLRGVASAVHSRPSRGDTRRYTKGLAPAGGRRVCPIPRLDVSVIDRVVAVVVLPRTRGTGTAAVTRAISGTAAGVGAPGDAPRTAAVQSLEKGAVLVTALPWCHLVPVPSPGQRPRRIVARRPLANRSTITWYQTAPAAQHGQRRYPPLRTPHPLTRPRTLSGRLSLEGRGDRSPLPSEGEGYGEGRSQVTPLSCNSPHRHAGVDSHPVDTQRRVRTRVGKPAVAVHDKLVMVQTRIEANQAAHDPSAHGVTACPICSSR